jgi:hypothetical protein
MGGDARTNMNTPGGASPNSDAPSSSAGSGRILYKAVVVEFLNDPAVYNSEYLAETFGATGADEDPDPNVTKRVSNQQFLLSAPRNTCVVRPVSSGYDKQNPPIVAYPFFPPHMCFPAKPGEQVWLIAETPTGLGELPMWLFRVPSTLQVDDINFTHDDRKLGNVSSQSTSEKLESQEEETGKDIPGFPNGAGTAAETSLKPTTGNNEETAFEDQDNTYDIVVTDSVSYTNFTPEEIPRFTKRPGDLVFQGSNNTAIILGEDRGWIPEEDPSSAESSNATLGYDNSITEKGTIDIVAGRGRWGKDGPIGQTTADATGDDPENTQPRLIDNLRKDEVTYVEVDKNPTGNELSIVIPEGDPDLVRDCSRVYVSMKTNGDYNFGISNSAVADTMATGFEAAIEDVDESPYVVLKSDEVRLVARKDEDNDINGSIRIVKQGTKDDDLATVALLPDGTIQISGSKIYIGRPGDDGGRDAGPGEGGSEPYVRYSDLKSLWEAFMDEMSGFCDTVLTHTTPGYGAPSVQLNTAATTLKSNIEATHKPDIANVQSERIFGE